MIRKLCLPAGEVLIAIEQAGSTVKRVSGVVDGRALGERTAGVSRGHLTHQAVTVQPEPPEAVPTAQPRNGDTNRTQGYTGRPSFTGFKLLQGSLTSLPITPLCEAQKKQWLEQEEASCSSPTPGHAQLAPSATAPPWACGLPVPMAPDCAVAREGGGSSCVYACMCVCMCTCMPALLQRAHPALMPSPQSQDRHTAALLAHSLTRPLPSPPAARRPPPH